MDIAANLAQTARDVIIGRGWRGLAALLLRSCPPCIYPEAASLSGLETPSQAQLAG